VPILGGAAGAGDDARRLSRSPSRSGSPAVHPAFGAGDFGTTGLVNRWLVPCVGGVAAIVLFGYRRRESATERFQDHATQSSLRNAVTSVKMFWIENGRMPSNGEEFASVDYDGLPVLLGDRPLTPNGIYVDLSGDRVTLSARSASGRCFYLSHSADGTTMYGSDQTCRPAADLELRTAWEERLSRADQRTLLRRLESRVEPLRDDMRRLFERVESLPE
jgi:hypothetical protein